MLSALVLPTFLQSDWLAMELFLFPTLVYILTVLESRYFKSKVLKSSSVPVFSFPFLLDIYYTYEWRNLVYPLNGGGTGEEGALFRSWPQIQSMQSLSTQMSPCCHYQSSKICLVIYYCISSIVTRVVREAFWHRVPFLRSEKRAGMHFVPQIV